MTRKRVQSLVGQLLIVTLTLFVIFSSRTVSKFPIEFRSGTSACLKNNHKIVPLLHNQLLVDLVDFEITNENEEESREKFLGSAVIGEVEYLFTAFKCLPIPNQVEFIHKPYCMVRKGDFLARVHSSTSPPIEVV